jgi:5-methylcytosine-specific restriction protein A
MPPDWTRAERILALDLYYRIKPEIFRRQDSRILELSAVLNSLSNVEWGDQSHARKPSSVEAKLRDWDRKNTVTGERLYGICADDQDVWREFESDRPRLESFASCIRAEISSPSGVLSGGDSVDDDEAATEGRIFFRWHKYIERKGILPVRKKQWALKMFGKLECEICAFDFKRQYGAHGKNFIECHHKEPLSTLSGPEGKTIDDLALVCSNCHRMLHRGSPWPSISDIRHLLATTSERV